MKQIILNLLGYRGRNQRVMPVLTKPILEKKWAWPHPLQEPLWLDYSSNLNAGRTIQLPPDSDTEYWCFNRRRLVLGHGRLRPHGCIFIPQMTSFLLLLPTGLSLQDQKPYGFAYWEQEGLEPERCRWEMAFRADPHYGKMKFKCLPMSHYTIPISEDLLEEVDQEDFFAVEPHRLPLFIGVQWGVRPGCYSEMAQDAQEREIAMLKRLGGLEIQLWRRREVERGNERVKTLREYF